jgi:GT2 family glycosyltransferase
VKITVSIGVIFFHGEKFWSHFGQSITEQTFRNFELLVFENSLPKINLKKNLPFGLKKKTNFFRTKRNLSFAAAHNFLIKKSRGQFYFCVNQDLIFTKKCLEILENFLQKNSEASAVMGEILRWNFSQNQKTKIIDSHGIKLFPNFKTCDENVGKISDNQKNSREIWGTSGAATLFRKKLNLKYFNSQNFKKDKCGINCVVNGEGDSGGMKKFCANSSNSQNLQIQFDENFPFFKEDCDLAARIRLSGGKNFLVPAAKIWHARGLPPKNFWVKSDFEKINSFIGQTIFVRKFFSHAEFFGAKKWKIFLRETGRIIFFIIFAPRLFFRAVKFFQKFSLI